MLLSERYALQHLNCLKFYVPTSCLVRGLFVCLLTLSGTRCLSVCFCEFLAAFKWHSLMPASDPLRCFINSFTCLFTHKSF